jgi:hypothetical protein
MATRQPASAAPRSAGARAPARPGFLCRERRKCGRTACAITHSRKVIRGGPCSNSRIRRRGGIYEDLDNFSGRLAAPERAALHRGLLVIVGAEAFSYTEIPKLSCRGHAAVRLSVDAAVDRPVDQTSVRSEKWPSLTPSGLSRTIGIGSVDSPALIHN